MTHNFPADQDEDKHPAPPSPQHQQFLKKELNKVYLDKKLPQRQQEDRRWPYHSLLPVPADSQSLWWHYFLQYFLEPAAIVPYSDTTFHFPSLLGWKSPDNPRLEPAEAE